ncbi:hypothetical protein ACQ3JU_0735 (plasmid) [Bradyrhizobium guangxiense]
MAVKDTAQVLIGDKLRELAFQSQLELAPPLPEFGMERPPPRQTYGLMRNAVRP